MDIQSSLKITKKQPNFVTTLIAQCLDIQKISFKNKQINKYIFTDQSESFSLIAFNPYLHFQINKFYILSGKVKYRFQEIQFFVNEYEIFDQEAISNLNQGRIVPIYSNTKNLTQKTIRNLIYKILVYIKNEELTYNLSQKIINRYGFPDKKICFQRIHFPTKKSDIEEFKKPLIYEEFYQLQKKLALKKKSQNKGKEKKRYSNLEIINPFLASLPYSLTKDQQKVIKTILRDLMLPKIMYRMLQGDVGTGKTLLAIISMVFVYLNGYQSVLMVPTEILAYQHFNNFIKILNSYSKEEIKITILTGGLNTKARKKALWEINEENKLLIIGTHALIQKNIFFKNLKYVIIDEQHRFGVEQRETLIKKGDHPDFCIMTATPIPRSLFISFFGDLDVSFLKEKPPVYYSSKEKSSKPVYPRKCKVLLEKDRLHAYLFLIDRIKRGEQAYVVFPVIEESNQKHLKSLLKEYEFLKKNVFKEITIEFIHGKKSSEEKKYLMEQFRQGNIKVLLATTVLEVGIDHPNATAMIIESAHQFGLSQLHQLRGRIGRGNKQGYCYLIIKENLELSTLKRLEKFCNLEDGFKIAELDLKIRGPGDLGGVKQSGLPPLKFGDLSKNFDILLKTRKDVYQEFFPQQEIPFSFTETETYD
jgi:ATP-dependent DNA helicase RecG